MYRIRKKTMGLCLGLALLCLALAGACTTTAAGKTAGAKPAGETETGPTANPTAGPTAGPIDVAAAAAPVFEAMEPLLIHEGYLLDMDGDGVAEIITRAGNCEADAMLSVYACEEGGARLVGTAPGSNCQLWSHADGGLVVQYGHMGVEQVDRLTIEDGALHTTRLIEQHEVEEYTQSAAWLSLEPCA